MARAEVMGRPWLAAADPIVACAPSRLAGRLGAIAAVGAVRHRCGARSAPHSTYHIVHVFEALLPSRIGGSIAEAMGCSPALPCPASHHGEPRLGLVTSS